MKMEIKKLALLGAIVGLDYWLMGISKLGDALARTEGTPLGDLGRMANGVLESVGFGAGTKDDATGDVYQSPVEILPEDAPPTFDTDKLSGR